jgi:hypothetical protein
MRVNIDKDNYIVLTNADVFVLQYMLGVVGQGHGHIRVRGFVPAIKYLRLTYGLTLEEACKVVRNSENELRETLNTVL